MSPFRIKDMSFLRMETWGRRDGRGVRMSSDFLTAELRAGKQCSNASEIWR